MKFPSFGNKTRFSCKLFLLFLATNIAAVKKTSSTLIQILSSGTLGVLGQSRRKLLRVMTSNRDVEARFKYIHGSSTIIHEGWFILYLIF